jgi:hypothetical protein
MAMDLMKTNFDFSRRRSKIAVGHKAFLGGLNLPEPAPCPRESIELPLPQTKIDPSFPISDIRYLPAKKGLSSDEKENLALFLDAWVCSRGSSSEKTSLSSIPHQKNCTFYYSGRITSRKPAAARPPLSQGKDSRTVRNLSSRSDRRVL